MDIGSNSKHFRKQWEKHQFGQEIKLALYGANFNVVGIGYYLNFYLTQKAAQINCVHVMAKSKGVGDTIEKITKATGIKHLVGATTKAVGIKDCGCNSRKDSLNRMFPYKKN